MTTVGTGSGSFSSNHPRKDRSKLRKQQLVRRSMLESLESRQVMAAGPQLIGAQPNEGALISLDGSTSAATVLNTSPREIVLRFDDTAGLDPATLLSGIQVKRAGADGVLSSAYVSTDLGTNGRVVLDFSAAEPGQQGNGVEIAFTSTSRSSSIPGKPASWPLLSITGSRINVQLNTLSGSQTTAADLIRAMTENESVRSRVLVKRLRGVESEIIANTVPNGTVYTLAGADAARVSTNLNSGTNTLQVEFLSLLPSSSGGGTRIEVVSRDFGGEGAPIVTVSGRTIRVEVNSNARFATTVGELIDAINLSLDSSGLVRARLVSGSLFTRMGANPTTYSPLTLVAGDDVAITPSFIGFGDTNREVVIRFAETLPDDFYIIDILGAGPFALRNLAGQPFNSGVSKSVRFDLDLGTTIQSVVPQPIVRNANGALSQLRNVIHVYFNDDDLNPVEAQKPEYYQLVHTGNTLRGTDDVVLLPVSVNYDSILNRSTLTFSRNLDALVDTAGTPLPITALRLRIGNNQGATAGGVTEVPQATDPGSRFTSAANLGGAWAAGSGAKSVIVNSQILNQTPYELDFPGANNEAGNRDSRYQHHVTRTDADGIAVISYNFASELGTANQSVQLNAITEPQKDLVRQIFSLYEKYLGVRFLESDSLGFTVAVGDMLAINPLTALTPIEANRAGGLTFAAGPLASNPAISAAIIDIQDFNSADDNLFGTELFRSFMRGIGVLLGLGSADELPQSTVQNNLPLATSANAEPVFPGNHDVVHGQHILRPEGRDIDLYRFTLPSVGGQLNLEIVAERQADSSLLDAAIRLYRNEGTALAPRWVELAANDDYFSKDPRVQLEFVRGGDYIVGVSAKGNTSYNPEIEDSGLGGKSEGKYQLRIDYRPPAPASLVDVNGLPTPLDGDGDGRPGGVHNYWFVPTRPDRATPVPGVADASAYTIWVDKTAANNGSGTLASPYNSISRALTEAANISQSDPLATRNVVVRILGNTQNRAYEIGFNRFGQSLADGATFDVPKNVTVMIDAGAIIKMGRARISAGSSTVSVDRSGGSLQLLGIPDSKVIVTSIHDTVGVGVNPDKTPPAPGPGDWGGIEFRNRIDGGDETRTDRERNGLFLNTVVHSDLRFGGGQVFVDGVSQVITPIHIVDSRPSIANNLITRSADAAMSATPNSFREDNFNDPRSQGNGLFVADYDRVGPDIRGNRIVNNTVNGLFIRTRTGAAENPETVTVAARFDDLDIVHVVGENLIVDGRPGGGIIDVAAPPTTVVTLIASAGGSLSAGTYNYRLVYVDAAGSESLASLPTSSVTVAANGSVTLNNLPPIGPGLPYVARRIYRSDATGGGTYRFVAQINAVTTTFVDNGNVTGSALVELTTKVRSRLDGSLMIDPGTIIKSQGSRIEVRNGGHLVAEGTASLPIVMTSINDARFGVGGTSDTSNTRATRTPNRGDWGGVFVGHASSGSLDNVRMAFAGGSTRIEGGFASFNPIEVHQADFRLTNSRIEQSASGTESSTSASRTGRGTNGAAAIFVRGSQPIIVNNRIYDNDGAAINIDVNSLSHVYVTDRGRSTGELGLVGEFLENQGPLVKGNQLSRNTTNGMLVRGQTITTQSVWDDSDIVHVVSSSITSDNLHTFGGLRLKSSASESLVVKFGGVAGSVGLTATGTPLDFASRIGGSLQVLGQPNFPVILTSLTDDTVGAGFGIDGRSNFDTNNDGTGSVATAGAWTGLTARAYSNDRNVAAVSERESARASSPAANDTPSSAQYLGQLSRQSTGGDENARLGFEIQGTINKPSDVDVYSFTANGRTEVWLDIDRTTFGLDTVVELIAADGTILALSDDSFLEETERTTNPIFTTLSGNSANPLRKSSLIQVPTTAAGDARDDYGTNPKDAGMRVVLPGQESVASLYHIRVRSSNQVAGQAAGTPALSNAASVGQGKSKGSYQLQVRLGEAQEFPGTMISHADIRFAANGVTLSGVPRHSPLVGETAEVETATTNNNTFASAQYLGNILQTDRSTISVAGSLSSPSDVDWFSFDISYQQLLSPLAQYLSTIFDIDYADGIGRADMSMYLFNSNGNLIHVGEDSNILDDRATALRSADNSDLGRGSTGTLDPYLGSVELPAGRYFLAVTSRSQIPTVLANRLSTTGNNDSGVRLQPVNSGRYIVEDRVDGRLGASAQGPIVPQFLPESSRVEYVLGDVPLYLLQDLANGASQIFLANSMTGQLSNFVGGTTLVDINDFAIRPNGDIRAFSGRVNNVRNDANANYILIDPGTGTAQVDGNFGVTTRQLNPADGQLADQNEGLIFNALTYANLGGTEIGFAVANRPLVPASNEVRYEENILYRFNSGTGAGTSFPAIDNAFNIVTAGNPNPADIIQGAGTSITERGFIQTSPLPGLTVSTRVALTEATQVRSTTQNLVNDGDTVSIRVLPSTNVTFEFNAGPELWLQLDPVNFPSRVLLDGDQFVIDGVTYQITTNASPGVIPGVTTVFYSPTMTNAQFVASLKQAVPSTIQVGFDGNRVNFSGAVTGSFNILSTRGVAQDLGSTGNVGSGRIAVDFLAEDTAETMALRLAQALNSAGFAGLSAVAVNNEVQLVNAQVTAATGSARRVGIAPGGAVTGIAQVNGDLFAVSDQGGLYRVSSNRLTSNFAGNIADYVSSSYNLTGIRFTGLSAGPRHVGGGQYQDILFGTDVFGNIHAFDTNGVPQGVFANGESVVSTGVFGLSGIAFSNLDYNLWHQSGRRGNDPGHNLNAPNDRSDVSTSGGGSWYFGFENRFFNNNVNLNSFSDPLAQPRALGTPLANTYNFPGGAAGVLESQPFSLAGMSSADKPTLYFNYFLSTEDANSSQTNPIRDSFRVYGQGDDGVWRLLVTNNSSTQEAPVERAIDNDLTAGQTAPGVAWRQARVDIGQLAGSREVRLRFEFSTAGGMGDTFAGGRGPEMRVVAGNQLTDGQTFNVNGRQFEIEMGSTLTIPSGNSIRNLDLLSVYGTSFVFWDGSGTAPAGNLIRFNITDTPTELALKIHDALRAATYSKLNRAVAFNEPLGGTDTLSRALDVGVRSEFFVFNGEGAIGDNTSLAPTLDRDVDLVRMNLEAGTQIVVTANATTIGSFLDPFLRIFDSEGRQLSFNNDFGGSRDSRIEFTVPSDGVYFVGVSASANNSYSASVANSTTNGGSQGKYDLTIDVTPRLNVSVLNNRIQIDGGKNIVPPANSPVLLNGATGLIDSSAVPVYISQGMTAEQVAAEVKRAMEGALAPNSSDTFARRGIFIDMTGAMVASPGPFTVSTSRPEDDLSEWGTNGQGFNRPALRARNNAFEGLYLDDFIIGLAERGEQVTGSRSDTTFVSAGPTTGPQGGTYQLEIRQGTEYGAPRIITSPPSAVQLDLVRSFGPNEGQSNYQSVRFNNATQIADGQTMTISDGVNSMVFEFDDTTLPVNSPARGVRAGHVRVPFNPVIGESAPIIASRVRDLINSNVVQNVLRIGAISADGSTTGTNSDEIVFVGSVTVTVPANIGDTESFSGTGDKNTPREQGQVVVENSRISNSSGFGIVLQADARDAGSNAPSPGSARNTIVLNNSRLAPGAVVVNNELSFNTAGGINVVGDASTGDLPLASVPFARVVNNTILGGSVTRVAAAPATSFEGDFYSIGSVAFADRVERYTPTAGGGPLPIAGLQLPDNAVGVPNYSGIGEPLANQGVVSLGRGGVLVLQFTDNILTGSDDSRPDLAVYEVGNSENIRVEVSSDNVTYIPVGTASFNSRLIDLDAFGFNARSQLHFVRLTDEFNQGAISGDSVGADIDAVGALSSRPANVFTAAGTGIRVGANASPTLMNNIVANNDQGIFVDPSSTSAVVGGTLFHRNSQDVAGSATLGQFPIVAPSTSALFTDASTGNLYPQPGSRSIDASLDSLPDRASLLSVKQPLGLLPSPIIAPASDITGQLRVDDPSVTAPPGLGESVFKDRGAADRSDFVGPIAIAINPRDNDALGTDNNPAVGTVEVVTKSLSHFDIQVLDTSALGNFSQGTGIDRTTVSPNAVLLLKNGKILVEGLDYRFGYDSTSNIIRLTPLAGIWESESVYQVRFVNRNESLISFSDPLVINDAATYTIVDSQNVTHYFELESGITLRMPRDASGFTNQAIDGTIFRIDDGFRRITFEFDNNQTTSPTNIAVPFLSQDPPSVLAEKVVAAVLASGLLVRMQSLGNGSIQLFGSNLISVIPESSGITQSGSTGVQPTYGFRIPTANGLPLGFTDGQTFSIQRGNSTFVFEFDSNGTIGANNIRVGFSNTTDGLAAAIVTAINSAGLGLTASSTPGGFIAVGAQSDLRLQSTNTVLQVVGSPGRAAAIPIEVDAMQIQSGSQMATLLANSITAANLTGIQVIQLGSQLVIEGAKGVGGPGAQTLFGIRDLAGNPMRATELDGTSQVTIFLGEGLDYGDAPDPLYASKKENNGPRHRVVSGFSLGPTITSDADAKIPDLDSDDGVHSISLTAAYSGSFVANVQGADGPVFINAWVDYNGNGVFENSEKIQIQGQIRNGDNPIPITKVPSSAVTNRDVALRVRLSTTQTLQATGYADDGEVEDYMIRIRSNPNQNPSNRLDVNNDGSVSAIDVLALVNFINTFGSGILPPNLATPPFLDVNGDSAVSVLDVLAVVNFLNGASPGIESEGEGESSDMWMPASDVLSRSRSSTVESTNGTVNAPVVQSSATRLDDYLASLGSEMGPSIESDDLDWAFFGQPEEEKEDDVFGSSLDELLN
ncbi:MAG: GEVED domain-containing protein [Pirellula sp.]